MQDDNKQNPPMEPKTPAGHDQMNGEGMSNGVPDAIAQGESKAYPHDERTGSETAAGESGSGS